MSALVHDSDRVRPRDRIPRSETIINLRLELLAGVFERLPSELRLQADDTMRAFVLTDAAMRDVASRVRVAGESKMAVDLPEVAAWAQALHAVKAQQDAANLKLNTVVDACGTLGVDEDTRVMLQGLFSAFVDAVCEANAEMQAVIARAAVRHSTARR